MGMYSSVEGADVSSSTRAGLPNVSQYGWSSYEVEEYRQLIEYVDEAKKYAEEAKNYLDMSNVLYEAIVSTKHNLDALVDKLQQDIVYILGLRDQIQTWYVEIQNMYVRVGEIYEDIKNIQTNVRDILRQIQALHLDITTMKAAIEISEQNARTSAENAAESETNAAASAANSEESYRKSYQLYLELKQGQVYRGAWNPHTGAYPAHQGTNSVWDVVLNENDEEVEFDGKRWFWGDRLFYSIVEGMYYQVESGTSVKSINGKAGAVILKAVDVEALPIGGGVLLGPLTVPSIKLSNTAVGITTLNNKNLISASADGVASIADPSHTKFIINTASGVLVSKVGSVESLIYTESFKPTPGGIGTYTSAEIDAKDESVRQLFSGYYNKTETDNLLSTKANQGDVVAALDNKVDKITTVNGKPLSGNITLSSQDTGSLPVSGMAMNDNALGVRRLDTAIAFEVGADKIPYISCNFAYQALAFNPVDRAASFPAEVFVNGNKRVYSESFKPTYVDVGAADMENGSEITLLKNSNADRAKAVKLHSKEGRLYAVSADGTVSQFYNDRSYRPTLADFGGLGVENGNELNFPSRTPDFYFGFRKAGASEISTYHFSNGKAQLGQYSNVNAKNFYADNGTKRVIHEGDINQTNEWANIINKIPRISNVGVMEAGKYIDMHDTGSTADFDVRLDARGDAGNQSVCIQTVNGTVEIGAKNTGATHIYTDRPLIAFNKPLQTYANSAGLTIASDAGAASYILSTIAGAPNWYLGKGDAHNTISLHSYATGTAINLHDNIVGVNTPLSAAGNITSDVAASGATGCVGIKGVGNRQLQMEIHSTGVVDIAYRNAAGEWKYPVGFMEDGSVRAGHGLSAAGFLDAENDIHIGADKYICFNVNRQTIGGVGWSLGEQSATGYLTINRYQNSAHQSIPFQIDNGDTTHMTRAKLYGDLNFDATGLRRHISADIAAGNRIHMYADPNVRQWRMDCKLTVGGDGNYGVSTGHIYGGGDEGASSFRGGVSGGTWDRWRQLPSALQVDCQQAATAAHTIWKATNWGSHHLAAMGVHCPNDDVNSTNVSLHVGSGYNNFQFDAHGQGFAVGGWHTGSDKRFKDKIDYLDNPKIKNTVSYLDKVCNLKSAAFEYKINEGKTCLGFVAQDVQAIIPEAVSVQTDTTDEVHDPEKDRLFIDSMAIIAVQNEAIKELKALVDSLTARVEQLEGK